MCRLPKKMTPNKAAFEALGFTFSHPADSLNYNGNIPKGWRLELSNPIGHVNIVDQQGRNRVKYDYKNATMAIIV